MAAAARPGSGTPSAGAGGPAEGGRPTLDGASWGLVELCHMVVGLQSFYTFS